MGDVDNYVEPFFGSGAVLLGRPAAFDRWRTGAETVNDADSYVENFWRALKADPDGVAEAADWPVNECALLARHLWLVNEGRARIARMETDPEFYDATVAGWWVWGINSWIGSGWCSGTGPWVRAEDGLSVVKRAGDAGQGVNRQRPHLGDAGQGDETSRREQLRRYMRELAERTRMVRVCCGDWSRVCGETPTVKMGLTAVFLDPPYAVEDRADCYGEEDSRTMAHDVREWCKQVGNDPMMRLALCGYDGEHNELESLGWSVLAWKSHGGYASQSSRGNDNKHRERIWFSPNCIAANRLRQDSLSFGD